MIAAAPVIPLNIGGDHATTHPDADGRVSVVVDGRTVEHVRADQATVYLGQVNARYAVWTAGGAGHFYVERYTLRDGRIERVPGATTRAGALYFDLGDCSGRTQHLVRLAVP